MDIKKLESTDEFMDFLGEVLQEKLGDKVEISSESSLYRNEITALFPSGKEITLDIKGSN